MQHVPGVPMAGPNLELALRASSVWLAYLARLATHTAKSLVLPDASETATLCAAGQATQLIWLTYAQLQAVLQAQHIPLFWQRLDGCQTLALELGDAAMEQPLHSALSELCNTVHSHCRQLQQLAATIRACIYPSTTTTLIPTSPHTSSHAMSPKTYTQQSQHQQHQQPYPMQQLHHLQQHSGHQNQQLQTYHQHQQQQHSPPQTPIVSPAAAAAAAATSAAAASSITGVQIQAVAAQQDPDSVLQLMLQLTGLVQRYRTDVCAMLMATATTSMSGLLWRFYSLKLQQLSDSIGEEAVTPTPSTRMRRSSSTAGQFSGGHTAGIAFLNGIGGGGGTSGAVASGALQPAAYHAEHAAALGQQDYIMGSGGGDPEGSGRAEQEMEEDDENTSPELRGRRGRPRLRVQAVMSSAAGVDAGSPHNTAPDEWGQQLRSIAHMLDQLGMQAASEEAYTAAVMGHTISRLTSMASRVYDREVLADAEQFLHAGPLHFLRKLLSDPRAVQEWRLRLMYVMYETLGRLRISEMFDIVVEYPDSLPAVRDTAACMRHTDLQATLEASFRRALHARLLHAGASATDIIHQYVATIRALREIDASGNLLSAVAEPIRQYLRGRADTIACLVAMVVQEGVEGGGSLLEELQPDATAMDAEGSGAATGGDEAALRFALATAGAGIADPWPSAAHAGGSSGRGGGAGGTPAASDDVVTMLIGVFGSPDVFINEYRTSLASSLLRKVDYETDHEIRTLELLKLRFGDAPLHACEVMLKDIADSKRLNANVRNTHNSNARNTRKKSSSGTPSTPIAAAAAATSVDARILDPLSATVMSYLFWPKQEEKERAAHPEAGLRLPAHITTGLDTWAQHYAHLKAPRKVEWRQYLGHVELEVQVGEVQVVFQVSPGLASMLMLFEEKTQLTLSAVAAELNLSATWVRRKAMFWLSHGVLVEKRAVSRRNSSSSGATAATTATVGGGRGAAEREVVYCRGTTLAAALHGTVQTDSAADDEPAVTVAGPGDALDELMGPYENYILGMLTTYSKGLPLERLHATLRMFVVSPKFDRSVEELAAYLALLVTRGKVAVNNEVYSKPPAPVAPSEN